MMSERPAFDLLIKNVRVVRPNRQAVDLLDLGIKDGKFARIAPEIAAADGEEVIDHSEDWSDQAA